MWFGYVGRLSRLLLIGLFVLFNRKVNSSTLPDGPSSSWDQRDKSREVMEKSGWPKICQAEHRFGRSSPAISAFHVAKEEPARNTVGRSDHGCGLKAPASRARERLTVRHAVLGTGTSAGVGRHRVGCRPNRFNDR